MLTAFYFALCFACMFLGVIIALHIHVYLGLAIVALFGVKFWLQLPEYN